MDTDIYSSIGSNVAPRAVLKVPNKHTTDAYITGTLGPNSKKATGIAVLVLVPAFSAFTVAKKTATCTSREGPLMQMDVLQSMGRTAWHNPGNVGFSRLPMLPHY